MSCNTNRNGLSPSTIAVMVVVVIFIGLVMIAVGVSSYRSRLPEKWPDETSVRKPEVAPGGEASVWRPAIVEIDGCEYIDNVVCGQMLSHVYTHKGDCRNPIHQYKVFAEKE